MSAALPTRTMDQSMHYEKTPPLQKVAAVMGVCRRAVDLHPCRRGHRQREAEFCNPTNILLRCLPGFVHRTHQILRVPIVVGA